MRFETSVQRLLVGILVAFGAVMAAAVYWTVAGPETALREPVNYRLQDAAASVIRGVIFGHDGTMLVVSDVEDNGFVQRRTADPALYSLTGYSSRQYGVGGAEAAYDAILRGSGVTEPLGETIQYDVLHLPRRGSDVRLTIDLDTQRAAAAALNGLHQPGGAVVMDATTGELLAIASSPTVDPLTLDTNWADLIQDPGRPFLNRATQGEYKLGSALGTVILTAWLIDGRGLDDEIGVPDALGSCQPPEGGLTVRFAYENSCDAALNAMAAQLGMDKFGATAQLFGLDQSVILDGFTMPPLLAPEVTAEPRSANAPEATVEPEATAEPDPRAIAEAALGKITGSPLEIAVTVAAIANGGNAPLPVLLDATRAPDADAWTLVPRETQTIAVTTRQTASAVANAMRESSVSGLAHSEVCTGTDIGAVIGMSKTGDETQVFFSGFARLADGHTVVVVLAFEGIDLSRAPDVADAGNAVLCAALAGYAEG